MIVARRRADAVWTSKRELLRIARRQRTPRGQHMPDAEVALDGRIAAVEVELTPNQRTRTQSIARDPLARYDAVWYLTTGAARRQFEELAARLCQVRSLPFDCPDALVVVTTRKRLGDRRGRL